MMYFWCLICHARRHGAECEKCGNACQLRPWQAVAAAGRKYA